MKKKHWMYMTAGFAIAGIALIIFSFSPAATTFPIKRGITSVPTGYSGTVELKNMEKVNQQATISPYFTGQLDQYQESVDYAFYIGFWPPDLQCYAQAYENDREPMNGFQVAVGKHGTPSEPMYIGIMEYKRNPLNLGNYHVVAELQPSDIPEEDVLYWSGLDFPDNPLNKYKSYVVCVSVDDIRDGNYWMWGFKNGDPYPRGQPSHWMLEEESWVVDEGYDMTFRTYTEGEAGEPPTITITSSYQVISQFLGSLSLLGAVITGTRYF